MRLSLITFILITTSCGYSDEEAAASGGLSHEDSLRQEANTFLSDPVFHDKTYQLSELKKYEGLWTRVKTIRKKDGNVDIDKYDDVLFSEGKQWILDYPCSWGLQDLAEEVFFRNDSIFFRHQNRSYLWQARIEFRGDTLTFDDKYNVEYFVRKQYDSLVLADLKEREFNEKCFVNNWELTGIDNGMSDTWAVEDGFLDHVPRLLDFSTKEFIIEGIYLVNATDRNIKFEIVQFNRSTDGVGGFLYLKELNEIGGTTYFYDYHSLSK